MSKRYLMSALLGVIFLSASHDIREVLNQAERYHITKIVNRFVDAVNDRDYDMITVLVSPQEPKLISAIQEKMRDTTTYDLCCEHVKKEINGRIRIDGRYKATGIGWEVTGFFTYFVFEKVDDQWLIVDTDFDKSVPIWIWVLVLIPITCFSFWLWMFIDCATSDEPKKITWILLLLFFNIIAAIFYFFLVKRKKAKF